MGKVVHVHDDIHALAKAYCAEKGLNVKDWVSRLIEEGAKKGIPISRDTVVPVSKKSSPPEVKGSARTEVYEQPPFWER